MNDIEAVAISKKQVLRKDAPETPALAIAALKQQNAEMQAALDALLGVTADE